MKKKTVDDMRQGRMNVYFAVTMVILIALAIFFNT
jgi:hypothetical protein